MKSATIAIAGLNCISSCGHEFKLAGWFVAVSEINGGDILFHRPQNQESDETLVPKLKPPAVATIPNLFVVRQTGAETCPKCGTTQILPRVFQNSAEAKAEIDSLATASRYLPAGYFGFVPLTSGRKLWQGRLCSTPKS